MSEFDVNVKDLDKLVARLRTADKVLREEFQKAMVPASAGIIRAARAGALATLPKRGGVNAVVARSRFTVRPIRGKGVAGIRIATDDHDPRIDLAGRLRHPVYNRGGWAGQKVPPGWFTRSARRATAATRALIRDASAGILRRLG